MQDDERLRRHLNQLVGTAEGALTFTVENAADLVLPLPDELADWENAFSRRYSELAGFLAAEEIESVVIWPLPGLRSNNLPIQLERDVEIDVLSDDELAAALNTEVIRLMFPNLRLLDPSQEKEIRVGLRCRYRVPKVIGENRQSPEVGKAREDRLVAVQEKIERVLALLFAEPVAVAGRAILHADWASTGVQYQQAPLAFAHRFRRLNLSAELAREMTDTWRQLSQPGLLQRQKALALALRRLSYQAYRQRVEDEIVDILVAAEALYLSDVGREELGFRLALRASAFSDVHNLGMTRREVFDLMRAAYNVRSIIVHGNEPKPRDMKVKGQPASLSELVRATEDVVRQGLRQALAEAASPKGKWPPDWDELTLPKEAEATSP
jgi:hypothetical protein